MATVPQAVYGATFVLVNGLHQKEYNKSKTLIYYSRFCYRDILDCWNFLLAIRGHVLVSEHDCIWCNSRHRCLSAIVCQLFNSTKRRRYTCIYIGSFLHVDLNVTRVILCCSADTLDIAYIFKSMLRGEYIVGLVVGVILDNFLIPGLNIHSCKRCLLCGILLNYDDRVQDLVRRGVLRSSASGSTERASSWTTTSKTRSRARSTAFPAFSAFNMCAGCSTFQSSSSTQNEFALDARNTRSRDENSFP